MKRRNSMKKETRKNKVRKSQIYQLVAIAISSIVAGAGVAFLYYKGIQNLFWIIIIFWLVFALIYAEIYYGYILDLKEFEESQAYFEKLKETLQGGEKEVFRKYGRNDDAKILKNVTETYGLRYFVRANEDSIFIFTRDCKDKESPHEPISTEFFQEYFEFKTE